MGIGTLFGGLRTEPSEGSVIWDYRILELFWSSRKTPFMGHNPPPLLQNMPHGPSAIRLISSRGMWSPTNLAILAAHWIIARDPPWS